MTAQELYDFFRSTVDDTVEPYLWSDTEVWAYMNDAQWMFCRLAYGISDASTTSVVEVTVTAAEKFSALHPSILQIRRAERASDGRPLSIVNFEDMDNPGAVRDDYGLTPAFPRGSLLDSTAGPVNYMVIGMEDNKARWVSVPEVADTVNLVVYRGPLNELTVDTGPDAGLEIDKMHHIHLIDWMKRLAYGKQDAETFDTEESEEAGREFTGYCDQAKADWDRKRHKPRLISYGGL
jgi:hypothetical protein